MIENLEGVTLNGFYEKHGVVEVDAPNRQKREKLGLLRGVLTVTGGCDERYTQKKLLRAYESAYIAAFLTSPATVDDMFPHKN